jgi:ribonuclease P protein component
MTAKDKMGVSVSKKNFKKRSRNYFKRVCANLQTQQHILLDSKKPYSFMFFISLDRLSYEEINTKTIQLFEVYC